jgi:DNA-binding CsgD family transcriptional regulator
MPSQPLGGDLASLTVAETAVLERLGSGSSNSQIAAALGVSPKTVANHLSSVYRKLGVATRTEAVHRYLTR